MDLQELGLLHGRDQSGSGKGEVVASFKCSIEPPVSIKCVKFLD
jgi:hypothetical protein